MATEDSKREGNPDPNHFTASGEGSPAGKPLPVQLRDKILLTTWIFSYAAILWIFDLITKFEGRSALNSSQQGRSLRRKMS
jgi:hypothetical protein